MISFLVIACLVAGINADANYTNATLPTYSIIKEVKSEDTILKVELRKFNSTDSNSPPQINCTLTNGKLDSDFQWTRKNGSQYSKEVGIMQSRYPPTGTLDQNAVVSSLKFTAVDTKAAVYVGEYKCTFSDATMYPSVFSAPVAKMSDKDYRSVMEGDKLTQVCSVVAFPTPKITWTRNNQSLIADERIKLSDDSLTLTINDLKKDDAGLYICSASNRLGVGEAYITLRVKDRYAALWPFLGIVAEVIILVTIILLYEKKRAAQKRNQDEGETAEVKDERNANDSDVRHRPVKT